MAGECRLDTNVVIAVFAGERRVQRKLKRSAIVISSVVIGELLFGALNSGRPAENVARIEEFALANSVLPCDTKTARHYAQIKKRLRGKGKPVPENDIWIAALALQHDLTLVSRDRHFGEIDNLKLESW